MRGFERTEMKQDDWWRLLSEHVAWLNQEKHIIWLRYSASLAAVSILFVGTVVGLDALPRWFICGAAGLGVLVCAVWYQQSSYGWGLQTDRLKMIREAQTILCGTAVYDEFPLTFLVEEVPGGRTTNQQGHDWIQIQAQLITLMFGVAFLGLLIHAVFGT